MSERMLTLTAELAEAERELREALNELYKAERGVRKANGWLSEVMRLLEEEDKHG